MTCLPYFSTPFSVGPCCLSRAHEHAVIVQAKLLVALQVKPDFYAVDVQTE